MRDAPGYKVLLQPYMPTQASSDCDRNEHRSSDEGRARPLSRHTDGQPLGGLHRRSSVRPRQPVRLLTMRRSGFVLGTARRVRDGRESEGSSVPSRARPHGPAFGTINPGGTTAQPSRPRDSHHGHDNPGWDKERHSIQQNRCKLDDGY